MNQDKQIVFGCDDTANLFAVLNVLKKTVGYGQTIVTTGKLQDLISISRSMMPALIILCFRNIQQALNEFNFFKQGEAIPLLCLTRKNEDAGLSWEKNNIVFTCPLEYIQQGNQLGLIINSIFLLKTAPAKIKPKNSFADNALQQQPHYNGDLSRYVLELDQKVEVLSKIKHQITSLYPQVNDPTRIQLMSIVNTIKKYANNREFWDDFKLFFEESNPGFLISLAKKYPFLTPIDLKYCCYLKMNMSNDDIKNILGISLESVRTHKYRLKKKMSLSKSHDLRNHLRSVG